jgi:hypothetical protein
MTYVLAALRDRANEAGQLAMTLIKIRHLGINEQFGRELWLATFLAASRRGLCLMCNEPADHQAGEVVPYDYPSTHQHVLTADACCMHFHVVNSCPLERCSPVERPR